MPDSANGTLETERLWLEPVREAHAQEAWEGMREPGLWTHFPALQPKTLQELRLRYMRWERGYTGPESSETWANWVCRQKAGGSLIGAVQATIHAPQSAYVAYMIFRSPQRRGFAREAMRALIAHLRAEYRLQRVYAEIASGNTASVALITALGFARIAPAATGDDLYVRVLSESPVEP